MAHASGDTRVWGAFDGGMRLAGVVAVTQEAGMHPDACGFHLWGLYVTLEDRGGPAARSEEHTSELQSLMRISYAVFRLKKKNTSQHQYRLINTKKENIIT